MMARDGQVEYDGEEVPKVEVAERSSSSPDSRSDIEDSRCPLDGVLGKINSAKVSSRTFHVRWIALLGKDQL